MIVSKDKIIGGRKYTVATIPAFQALDLLEELSVIAGPAFGAMMKNGLSGEVDFEAAAVQLFKKLGGGKLRALARGLLFGMTVEISAGKTPLVLDVFDAEYAGKLSEAFKAMAFAAEVQFADFFAEAKSKWDEFMAESGKASLSSSQNTSSTVQ